MFLNLRVDVLAVNTSHDKATDGALELIAGSQAVFRCACQQGHPRGLYHRHSICTHRKPRDLTLGSVSVSTILSPSAVVISIFALIGPSLRTLTLPWYTFLA